MSFTTRKRKRSTKGSASADEKSMQGTQPDEYEQFERSMRPASAAFPWQVGYDEKMRSLVEYGTLREGHSVLPKDLQRLIASKLNPCDFVPNIDCSRSKVYRDPFGISDEQEINCTDYCADLCRTVIRSIIVNAPKTVTLEDKTDNVAEEHQVLSAILTWPIVVPGGTNYVTVIYNFNDPNHVNFSITLWMGNLQAPMIGGRPIPGIVNARKLEIRTKLEDAVDLLCDFVTSPESVRAELTLAAMKNRPNRPNDKIITVGSSDPVYQQFSMKWLTPADKFWWSIMLRNA